MPLNYTPGDNDILILDCDNPKDIYDFDGYYTYLVQDISEKPCRKCGRNMVSGHIDQHGNVEKYCYFCSALIEQDLKIKNIGMDIADIKEKLMIHLEIDQERIDRRIQEEKDALELDRRYKAMEPSGPTEEDVQLDRSLKKIYGCVDPYLLGM